MAAPGLMRPSSTGRVLAIVAHAESNMARRPHDTRQVCYAPRAAMAHEQEPIVRLEDLKSRYNSTNCALGRANIKPKGGIPQTRTLICNAPREGREGKVDADDDDRVRKCDRHEKVR